MSGVTMPITAGAAAGLTTRTQVLTPTGWTTAGMVRAGDVLVDTAGQPCRARSVGSVGRQSTFLLLLADGGTIRAGAGQPWIVEVGKGGHRRRRTLTTLQVQDAAARKIGVRLVRSQPVEMPGISSLPIAPYTLGVLLGDGSISSNRYVKFWSCEPEISNAVRAELPEGACLSSKPTYRESTTGWGIVATHRAPGANEVLNGLRALGLAGLRSFEKHVPPDYLWAPATARHALLQGLLDTDGACDPHGQVSFSSASRDLSEGVVHLVRSLGGRCSLHVRGNVTYTSPTQRTPKAARDSYKVGGINLPGLPPFRLARKAVRVRVATKEPLWTVREVQAAPATGLLQIEVDSPSGLFLAEDFVPVASIPTAATVVSAREAA